MHDSLTCQVYKAQWQKLTLCMLSSIFNIWLLCMWQTLFKKSQHPQIPKNSSIEIGMFKDVCFRGGDGGVDNFFCNTEIWPACSNSFFLA